MPLRDWQEFFDDESEQDANQVNQDDEKYETLADSEFLKLLEQKTKEEENVSSYDT